MDGAICRAIRGQQVIRIVYDGGDRLVEPHLHGFSATGAEMMLAWQVDGFSRSGVPTGWKMFSVAKIGSITETEATFAAPRPDFDPVRALTRVHCGISALGIVR